MFGYVITCVNAKGGIFTVSEGEFDSYAEAADALDNQWQVVEDDGCVPIDYEIFEN